MKGSDYNVESSISRTSWLGDDAICSCSSVLMSDKFSIDILTLSERSSEGLSKIFPSVKSSRFLDLNDLNFYDRPKVNTHDIHRRFLDGQNVYSYYSDLVLESFNDRFYHSAKEILTIMSNEILYDEYDVILCPVGLVHPYHIVTRTGVILESRLPVIHYVDKPYFQYRYAKEMYSCFKSNLNLDEVVSSKEDKSDIVIKTFKEVYPTEQGMLRFSRDILTNSEDIYCYEPKLFSDNLVVKFKESLG